MNMKHHAVQVQLIEDVLLNEPNRFPAESPAVIFSVPKNYGQFTGTVDPVQIKENNLSE